MAGGEEDGGPEYGLRWQVPACAAILAVPVAVSVAVISRSRAVDPPRSSDLWSPCWKKLSPLWLLGLRALALSILFWLLCRAVLVDGAFAFYFYTQWTLSLVIIYFLIGTFISAHGCWIYAKHATENDEADTFFKRDFGEELPATSTGSNRNTKSSKFHNVYEWVDNEQKAGFWGYLMQIAYQTSAGAVTLTDIVFWGLLVPFLSAEHFKLDMVGAPYLCNVFNESFPPDQSSM